MTSPLELLTNHGERQPTFLSDKIAPLSAAALGFCLACFVNFGMRKPVFSGIQQHAFYTIGGGALGAYFDKKRNERLAERDAVFRHYIELHPEDFPTPEKKVRRHIRYLGPHPISATLILTLALYAMVLCWKDAYV